MTFERRDFAERNFVCTIWWVALALLVSGTGARQAMAKPLFEDVASSLGVDFVHQNGMTGKLYFAEMAGSGVALFDADGDGDLDLYVVEGGPLEAAPAGTRRPSDRLYRNDLPSHGDDGRHRFVDVTVSAGLAGANGYGMGVAAGDADNDGRIDLYVTNLGANQLWHNTSSDGGITFEEVAAAAGVDDPRWSVPALFFDYDADGVLDLYVGNYVDFRLATHKTCSGPGAAPDYCGPASYGAEPGRLFRGLGPSTGDTGVPRFEDVTARAGLRELNPSLGAVVDDFDGDGWLDLYVANDGVANRLYLNQGDGRFLDDALLTGTAVNQTGVPEASMGVVAGDIDGNGSPDLFMTHLALETNTLYLNDGQGLFDDRSRESGLGNASWRFTGFGTALGDFDVDGHLDLFVANGAVTIIDAQRLAGVEHPLAQTDLFFRGQGGGRFVDATEVAGPALSVARVSRGLAQGDIDNDGDPDLVMANNKGPVVIIRNTTDPAADRWLGLRLVTADGTRDALGSRAVVRLEGAPDLWRRVSVDGSYASASDARILVGWPKPVGESPIEVEVRWPSGGRETFSGLRTGRYQTLRQGRGRAVDSSKAAPGRAQGKTGDQSGAARDETTSDGATRVGSELPDLGGRRR